MPRTVLVAGATGQIGRRVADLLAGQGHTVRRAARSSSLARAGADAVAVDPCSASSWAAALEGCDTVVSCLGASVTPSLADRQPYGRFDVDAHRALAQAMQQKAVKRMVYLSVQPGPGYEKTRYVQAHLQVEQLLLAALPDTTAVRPTGIFTALDEFLNMARRGRGVIIGDGTARTNPIHPDDVAEAVVRAIDSDEKILPIGGPDVLTREEILRLAFEALGRPPRLMHAPAWAMQTMASLIRPLHPRVGDLMSFAIAVSTSDGIAPAVGQRRLIDWFRAQVGE